MITSNAPIIEQEWEEAITTAPTVDFLKTIAIDPQVIRAEVERQITFYLGQIGLPLPIHLKTNGQFVTIKKKGTAAPLGTFINLGNGQVFVNYGTSFVDTTETAAKALHSEYRGASRVRASSVSACQRQIVAEILGYEKDTSGDKPQYRIASWLGRVIHSVLESFLERSPIVSRQEFSVGIPGVFGGVVDVEVDQKGRYIVDWKTVSSADFRQGTTLIKIQKYYAQLMSYAQLLDIAAAVVVLVNRETMQMLEIPLAINQGYGKQLIDRAYQTMEYVRLKELPEPEMSNDCTFCAFRRLCGL